MRCNRFGFLPWRIYGRFLKSKMVHSLGTSKYCGDSLLKGLTFDPFVTVEHILQTEWRMSTDFNGDKAPLGIDNMKVVVIDIRPGSFTLQVRAAGPCRYFWSKLSSEPLSMRHHV